VRLGRLGPWGCVVVVDRQWRRLAGLLAGIVGSAVAVVISVLVPSRAVADALLVVVVLAVSAVGLVARRSPNDQAAAAILRNLVVADNDRLPLVRELNDPIALGVHPVAAAGTVGQTGGQTGGGSLAQVPPFVARDVMEPLDAALRGGGFVLLVGESVSGKSRAAYEAMRSRLPDHVFVLPGSRAGLDTVEQVVEDNRRCVIWLNDLDRFLGPFGLTPAQVASWHTSGGRSVILLATMQSSRYREYLARRPMEDGEAGQELLRAGQAVIEMAKVITVERQWSAIELARAEQYADDPRIAEALKNSDRFGLAEYMTAAPQLYEDWNAAWAVGAHPRGAAMVAAAVDIKRGGWHRPIPRELLDRLHGGYLNGRGGAALQPESPAAALEWATTALHATDSLLLPVGDGHWADSEYLVFDYLPETVDAADGGGPQIPGDTWSALIASVSPADAWDIGQAAFRRQAFAWAETAFAKAAQTGDHTAVLAQARAFGRSGRMAEAVELLRADIDRTTLRLGANYPDAPRSRYELLLWQTKQLAAALGPDHPDTLASRHELAHWTGQSGHAREAVEQLRLLVEDRTRVLGPDHPATLASRHEFAEWTGEAGDLSAAERLLGEVVADWERVLGDDGAVDALRSRARQAWWIGRGGRPDRAEELLKEIYDELVTRYGPDDEDALASLHELAYWTGHAGDPHLAEQRFADVIAARERVLGHDDPDTLTSRSNHARWVGEAGRPAEAVRLFDKVIADRERVLGPDHPETLWSRHRRVYWTAEVGDPAEAVRVLSVVLADRERVLGKDHPQTLDSRHHLARWIARAGDPPEAVRRLEEVLADRRRVMGPEHPDTLATLYRLALCRGLAGDQSGALAMLTELVDQRERVQGRDHLDTLATRHETAYWTAMTGDRLIALAMFENVAADRRRILGEDHPYALDTWHEIAYWTGIIGDRQRAIRLFERVIDSRGRVLGADHPRTLESRHAHAHCIAGSGDLVRAIALLGRVIADRRRTLGPDHPDTLASLHEQAYWTYTDGNLAEAAKLFDTVVAGRERALGAEHPLTLDSKFNLARIVKPADITEQSHLLEQILKQLTRTLSPDHPDVLPVRRRLALLIREPEESRLLLEVIAHDYDRSLGRAHPDTLIVHDDLARRTWQTGDPDQAISLMEAVVQSRGRVLGANHPLTVASWAKLEDYLREAGRGRSADGPGPDGCEVWLQLVEDGPLLVDESAHILVRVAPGPDHAWAQPRAEQPALEVVATALGDADIEPSLAVCEHSRPAQFRFVPHGSGSQVVRFTLYAHATGTALQQVEAELTVASSPQSAPPDQEG
jgi:eukaryotic-like serine/threonine-protein kinase